MRLYCTLFDRNYLTRGLALHHSISRHCGDFVLVVLCLDSITHDVLESLALPGVVLVSIESLEANDADLLRARSNRTNVEYYFTCKPVLMMRALEMFPVADRVTYLDADLYYFSSPLQTEKEYADSSVALTPHDFPSRLEQHQQYGQFNAGWVSAGTSAEGRRFLDWWRLRCIEWCRLKVEVDRFGDQKYLNQVPDLFAQTRSLSHLGVNVAPWNLDGIRIEESPDGVKVDGRPLVFMHFHGFKRVFFRLYDSGLHYYGIRLTSEMRRLLYRPYISQLSLATRRLSGLPSTKRRALESTGNGVGLSKSFERFRIAARLVASHSALVGP